MLDHFLVVLNFFLQLLDLSVQLNVGNTVRVHLLLVLHQLGPQSLDVMRVDCLWQRRLPRDAEPTALRTVSNQHGLLELIDLSVIIQVVIYPLQLLLPLLVELVFVVLDQLLVAVGGLLHVMDVHRIAFFVHHLHLHRLPDLLG